MRNPNGFGAVVKLSGKRRKPFMARVTIGWDMVEGKLKQNRKVIGYYEKREQAIKALADYNTNPYDLDSSSITFEEVFEKWKSFKYDEVSQSAINGYNAAYKIVEPLHKLKFIDIKTAIMQTVIKNSGKKYDTLRKVKVLLNQLFKYAMENDIVSKDYSQFVDIGKNNEESSRSPFTQKEIKRLFEVADNIEYVDTILMMIYTGFRIGELLTIESCNVDLVKGTIIGGIKTEAGKDRLVPINNKIRGFIEKRLSEGHNTLIAKENGKPMKYDNYYREKFTPIMDQLGMKHTPHDCRHTFGTLMSNAKADTISIQKIIGHSSYEITANIYTHKDIEQLKNAIDLI